METISLAHGNGGQMMDKLIDNLFFNYLDNNILKQKDDSSILPEIQGKPVISTDSFVVDPIFFPGGDIGKLAVSGTVNDLAMSGAKPLYLTAGFILEEGFAIQELEKVLKSMARTAAEAQVKVVAGDTKVVEKGKGDKIYINTSGVGVIEEKVINNNIEKGDKIIINGTIGEHGLTILKERKNIDFETDIKSDCCVLTELVNTVLTNSEGVKFMRDPTRGGIATVLNEIADKYNVAINIKEENIPIKREVKSLCNILGLDPLYLANEGKVVIIADKEESKRIVEIMKQNKYGRNSCIIGTINNNKDSSVTLKTKIGGERIINKLIGDMLPRLC